LEAAITYGPSTSPWSSRDGSRANPVELRLRALLEVAELCHVPMTLEQLAGLLPSGATWTPREISSWLEEHPAAGRIVAGRVVPRLGIPDQELIDRARRSEALCAEAEWAVSSPLRAALRFSRCVGVSGSVAYGFAEPGDDLDFFVTTRQGGTWLFLLYAFLSSRFVRRRAHEPGPSSWCFNYVIEETEAARQFAHPGGLLFAREALSVRILRGEAYYESLLRRAAWMSAELPQLYAERRPDGTGTSPGEPSLGLLARLANLVAFPLLATYLQLSGLVGNHRLRREAPAKCFSTTTTLRRFMLRSLRFEQLDRIYRAASEP
jgi:hypothetical protein